MASAHYYSTDLGEELPGQGYQTCDDTTGRQVNWFKQMAVFQDLSRFEVAEVASAAKQRNVPARQPVFCEDDPICSVFIIVSGRVKVTRFSRGGKEVILRINGVGDMVDELSLAGGGTHRFTALPLEMCQLLVWDLRTFQAFARRFPALQMNVAKILGLRLHTLQQRFCDLATEHVPQRLARTLVGLAEQTGRMADNTIVGLSCEELAQMTGTTMFTVSRLLSHWTECGIIQTERKSILIDNLPGLTELAEGEGA